MATLDDTIVRQAAFEFVREACDANGMVRYAQLTDGIWIGDEQIHLVSAGGKGIHPPQQLDTPISIRTAAPSATSAEPYNNRFDFESGRMLYRYEGKGSNPNPYSHGNEALRVARETKTPMLFLYAIRGPAGAPLSFAVSIGQVIGEEPGERAFVIALRRLTAGWQHLHFDESDLNALVVSATEQRRLGQTSFRHRVLEAYRGRCTLCRLNQEPLLDAAHIKPHSEHGLAVVPNGLAMCTLHHRAFDRNIIGIAPDRQVSVRTDVLEGSDGPMLTYGLQGFHKHKIWVPRGKYQRPKRAYLEERYEEFKTAT